MENMNLFFGLLSTGCGIYCLYLWLRIARSGSIPDGSIVVPRGSTMAQCLDADEFRSAISPRLLIFSLLIIVDGAFTLADSAFGLLDAWTAAMSLGMRLLILELVTCIIPLGVVIWFAAALRSIQKRLW